MSSPQIDKDLQDSILKKLESQRAESVMYIKPPSISPSKKIRETQEMDLRREMEILKE